MTTATMPERLSKTAQAATILQRSVCLTLECHWLGNDRKVDLGTLVKAATKSHEDGAAHGLDVDEKQFRATKKLIDSDELLPVTRNFGLAKALLRRKAIPAHNVFGERSYLIPSAMAEEIDADLTAIQHDVRREANLLAYDRYQKAVQRQRAALKELFDEGDYLTPAQVAAKFSLDWNWVSFAAPENLEQISTVLARKAEEKHTSRLASAFDEIMLGLRTSAYEVFRELEERLTPGDDGKPKVIRGTALKDLLEFAQYLPARNMTGDDALATVVKRVMARADGLTPQDLRDNEQVREHLRRAAAEAKVAVGKLVETGRRAISLSGALDLSE